jgi:phosphohistidine swiveling domain-containing protein
MTAAPKHVYAFGPGLSEGDPARVDLLGGKGASLAAMSRAGFPVPPGFTISAECCAWAHAHDGQWPDGLEQQIRDALGRLEESTRRTFGRGPKPLLIAVRSGAPVSMPGMMDTILNCGLNPDLAACYPAKEKFWSDYADHIRMFAASVAGLSLASHSSASCKGRESESLARSYLAAYGKETGRLFPTDPWDALAQCIDAVFASWHSERARAYRQHHDVRGAAGTAVNVQMMFPSERSGVLFTVNPNDVHASEMILEASWGLGEVVVSGATTPDIYTLDARSLRLKCLTPGDRPGDEPALTPEQVQELGQLGRKVEDYFQTPSDVEWGIADGQVALLQTRAIRGLDVLQDAEVGRHEEIERLRGLAGKDHVVWVVHNLSETLPSPTPLTWDIIRQFMSGAGGYGRLYRELGYTPSRQVESEGFLELICGRIYADPRRAPGMFYGELPFEYDMREVLADPQSLELPPRKLNVERADTLLFLRLPGLVWSMLRAWRRMKRIGRSVQQRFEQQALPKLREFLHATRQQDLTSLDTGQLIAELDRRRRYVMGELAAESLLPGYFAGLAHARLVGWLTQLMGDEQGENLAERLTTGLPGDITVEQNVMLHRISRGECSLEDFVEKFGHRAAGEMELSQPRWREDTAYLQRIIASYRRTSAQADDSHRQASPEDRHARQVEIRQQTENELPAILAEWGGSSLLERIRHDLDQAQSLLPYREIGKFHLMRGYETIRAVLMEMARRWDLGRDVFFLQLDELPSFESQRDEHLQRIARRKLRWKSAQKLVLRDVIDSRELDGLGEPDDVAIAEGRATIEARPIAAGAAIGVARVVLDPRDAGELGSDYILVCPSTDPGWTPLFVNARGLIVERGGILSHGAIVARDFGIPAVVCQHATRSIADGARIEIDGSRGRIVFLEPSPAARLNDD